MISLPSSPRPSGQWSIRAISDSSRPTGTNSASRAAFADDAQRAVPGGDQFDRGLDDLPEHDLEFEVAADRDHGFEEGMRPVPGVEDRLQPKLQLDEEVIEPQVRQQRAGVLALHRLPLHINMPDTESITTATGPAQPTSWRWASIMAASPSGTRRIRRSDR